MRLRHLVMSTLAAVSLTGLPAMAADSAGSAASGSGEAASNRPLTLDVSDRSLDVVLSWISRRTDVNIVCNEQDQPRITMHLQNVAWQDAVRLIAEKYDLVIEKRAEKLWNLTRPPKVRMEFQDAKLGVVLEALARQANVNIVYTDIDAEKKITMTLRGVPWKHALDVIVKDCGLAYVEREYNIIQVVTSDKLQKDLSTQIFPLNYGKAEDVKAAIQGQLGGGTVIVDAPSNSLVVTATPPALTSITKVIQALDSRTRQVLIEMRFVDFSNSDAQKLGFDPVSLAFDVNNLGRINGNFSGTPTAGLAVSRDPTAGIPMRSGNISAEAAFEAIASLSSSELLQSPSVLTLDNKESSIVIGRELHFAESSVAQDQNGTVTTMKEASGSPVKDGIQIKVTPHITSDGYVSIALDATNDEATLALFTNGVSDPARHSEIQLPNISKTAIKTAIMIQDGRTGVIGGLLRNRTVEQETHVPFLGDLPLLGNLFRKTTDTAEKRNLTIFITPRIVHADEGGEFERRRTELKNRLSGARPKPVEAAQPTAKPGE